MGRLQKDGLLYFPIDVHFFSETNTKVLRAKLGEIGVLTYLFLLCLIYENGYYVEYTEDVISTAAVDLGRTENFIRQVVDFLAERSMLDSTLLSTDKVLTSRDIQLQYQESMKGIGSKREVEVEERYWLLEPSKTRTFVKICPVKNKSEKKEDISKKKSSKSEKNAANEIKGNKRKEKEIKVYERQKSRVKSCRYLFMSSSQKILLLYREMCPSLSPVNQMGAKVRGYIRDGIRSGYTIDDYRKLFGEVSMSKFLRGEAKNTSFRASFGWLVEPEHMAEVLRGDRRDWGVSDSESADKKSSASFELDDFFEAAVRKSYSDDI